ncbi:hypothetical protein BDL97_02G195600 [Sphagnum fallax]|nr:hypothetical protein BDL97_02G195600 [Sphagnum fallax]
MVKTCEVKVDKDTHIVEYDDEDYEKLIYEVTRFAKEGRNAFKCIHCMAKFTSKQRLNYHRLKGCDLALDIDGKPLELKLYPSMPSGGAAEVKDILEKCDLLVRNTFNCIHCNKECASEQQLDYHRSMCSPGVPDINGQPSQQKLFPSVPSVGAAEVRDISEKHNLHRVCEIGKCDQLASFGEDVLLGSPLQLLCKDGSELPEALCVTPIVYKEHPESHEVSFLVMQDGLSFLPAFVYQEELDKESLSIYQGKGLFDFLRQKANKALWVVSVTELENCIKDIAPIAYNHLTACTRLDYPKIYSVIVDRIVEKPDLLGANTRIVQIEDVPTTIWAPMTGLALAGKRVTNIIIMGRHEDCTIFGEAERESWISWGKTDCLEEDWKLTPWEREQYVEWVQDLLWNCNKLILSRRSVVPSCFPSVFNSLDGCQDMHNSKEVLVTQRAKSKDSSERNKKSFADVPPGCGEGRERRFGNSGGNEDVIHITKRQQFTRLVRLTCEELHLRLSLEWWYTMSSRWYEDQAKVAQKYIVWLDKTYPSSPLRLRLDILQQPPHFLKWPDSLDKFHQAYEFEMIGCSEKIVAPWVQWQTPPSEQNIRE